jgi:hypothetical protein
MISPDYRNSIMNVSRSLLRFYGAYDGDDTVGVLDEALDGSVNHVIYMLLDGLGMNIIKAHLPESSFVRKNLAKTVTSVFPPTTSAATTAVLSAKPPIETGWLGWMQRFESVGRHVILFKNTDYYTEETLDVDIRKDHLPYETITETIRRVRPDVKTTVLFPSFVPNGSKTFSDMLFALDVITDTNAKSMTYAYWTEPDLSIHEKGIGADDVGTLVRELDRSLEDFSQKLPGDALLVLIADHGMIDVEADPLHDDAELLAMLRTMPSLESRATVFHLKDGMKDAFIRHFKETYKDNYELYDSETLISQGLFGTGRTHPMARDFLGDMIAIATKDRMLSVTKGFPFKAHHAGMTKEELEVPLVIFKKRVILEDLP